MPASRTLSRIRTVSGTQRASAGYTFIEVWMGVAIMVILFVTFYSAMVFCESEMRVLRENLRATQIVINHMEGIRLYRWDQLTNPTLLPTTFTEPYNPMGTNGSQGVTYTGTVSIATATLRPAATYSTNIYLITVQVQWNSGGGMHSRQMSTYAALNGIQNYVFSNPD